MAVKKGQEETRNDVVANEAASKKEEPKSFAKTLKDMEQREKESVVVKSSNLKVVDLSKASAKEVADTLAELQAKKLLYGWNPKTKEALVVTDEFAEKQVKQRAELAKKKEEEEKGK